MIVKITSERQITFPAGALEEFGMEPGDQLEVEEVPGGFILPRQTDSRPRQIDESLLGLLADQIAPDRPRRREGMTRRYGIESVLVSSPNSPRRFR